MGVFYDIFFADISKYALSTKDVGDAVYQWKVVAADGGISFNPSNELSLKLIVQKQIARFAPNYYATGEYMEKDEKLFLVCEYKPSVGNVISWGAGIRRICCFLNSHTDLLCRKLEIFVRRVQNSPDILNIVFYIIGIFFICPLFRFN